MSMSNLSSPVLGEKPGYGSAAGPLVYAVGPAGIQVTVNELLFVTRVTSVRERTGQLKCQILAAVVGDMPNVVRIAAMNPHHSMAIAAVRTALRVAAAVPADHAAIADIQGALVPVAHAHDLQFGPGVVGAAMGTDAGPALQAFGGAGTVPGGAVGATGAINAVHVYAAGVNVTHNAYNGVTAIPVAVGEEVVAGTDLSPTGLNCIFDVEAVGI